MSAPDSKPLDINFSREIAHRLNSKATAPFDNAYKAAVSTEGAVYVQGFLVLREEPCVPIEHGWIELDEQIIDPTFPLLNQNVDVYYFPAHRLSVKQLTAAIEEAQEDYPEDDPLPVYGAAPYEYYGEVMLGGADYAAAYREAETKCKELNSQQQK